MKIEKVLSLLNTQSCKIMIDKASSKDIFITEPGLFEHDGELCVHIPHESIIVPIFDISKIEVKDYITKETTMMEINWHEERA